MGRTGNLLRQMGKQTAKYTITGEWLEQHDREVIAAYRRTHEAEIKKEDAESTERINKAWFENAQGAMSFWLAVSVRILIEDFNWKPPRYKNARQTKTERYSNLLIDKINEISHNPRGFRNYSEETRELYGIEFHLEEE